MTTDTLGELQTRPPENRVPTFRERQRAAVERALETGRRPQAHYAPNFASPEMLDAAAALFVKRPGWTGSEGPVPRIEISPGVIAVSRRNYARRERTSERAQVADRKGADMLAEILCADGRFPDDPTPTREIRAWSRKSRSRMRKTIGQIDWYDELTTQRIPAMVTLTYPGDWLTVAPNGKTSKRHVRQFRKAYRRCWGEEVRDEKTGEITLTSIHAFWKMEFQHRGAPHYHLFMVPPLGKSKRDTEINGHWVPPGLPFKMWLSVAWAACVDAPDLDEYLRHLRAGTGVDYDKGLRGRDPRRIAEYFTKDAARSAKEYQNIVPPEWQEPGEGPGRFWGYWGIEKRVVGVELGEADAIRAARLMRRWFAAKGAMAQQLVPRRAGVTHSAANLAPAWVQRPEVRTNEILLRDRLGIAAATRPVKTRRARRRIGRMRGGAGWISVNDGPAYASQLSRYLDLARADDPGPQERPAGRASPPGEWLCCYVCGDELAPVLKDVGRHYGCIPAR